jgi:hypothetical protein
MKFKKIFRIFISALVFSTTLMFITPSNAAQLSGSKCAAKGKTTVQDNKVFECIKSGKKLIWNKGVEIDSSWYAWNFRVNSKGLLERKESNFGKWSSAPSRKGQIVDPIRLKAFNEIQAYLAKRNRKVELPSIRYSPNVNIDVKRTLDSYFAQSIHFFYDELPSNSKLETIISTEKDDEFFKSNILEIEKDSAYGLEKVCLNNLMEQIHYILQAVDQLDLLLNPDFFFILAQFVHASKVKMF